jgi:hypothetical protein
MDYNETPTLGASVLSMSYSELEDAFDLMTTNQARRLLESGMKASDFLAQPREQAVTKEIREINRLLDQHNRAHKM